MITQVNLFDLMIAANWIFIKLKLERRRMATSTSSKEQQSSGVGCPDPGSLLLLQS